VHTILNENLFQVCAHILVRRSKWISIYWTILMFPLCLHSIRSMLMRFHVRSGFHGSTLKL
jgi:hypothetical protein